MARFRFVEKGSGTPTGRKFRFIEKQRPLRRISPKRLAEKLRNLV